MLSVLFFLLVKVRKLISNLEKDGLTFNKVRLSLNNLSKSNYAVDYFVKKNINDNSNYLKLTKTIILKDDFLKQPDEIVFRSISELIHVIGNKTNYTRGKKLISLINKIKTTKSFKRQTLSGCIFEKVNKSIVISSEN